MKKQILLCILALFIVITLNSVSAVQPTQQYNKIYLNPFYRPSMSINTNFTYNITVNPPDGISSIKSAIIVFDTYITPTVTFTLFVDGKSCNNPSYIVSTTFAGSGLAKISFDCTNVITQAGDYNFNLRVTQANTGASTAYLELTYMNRPIGEVDVAGTEYAPGDPATIFVQLKDSDGLPVHNGSCYLDIYNPLLNGTHQNTVVEAPMLHAEGVNDDDGLYYYDLTAPTTLGVYMLSALCSYSHNFHWIFGSPEEAPNRSVILGTYAGASNNLQEVDGNYESCVSQTSGGFRKCEAYYVFNASDIIPAFNATNFDVYYAGEASAALTGTIQIWNFRTSSWETLPNLINFASGTAESSSSPSGVDYFVSNSLRINLTDYYGNATNPLPYTIWIRTNFQSSGAYTLYNNWLNIRAVTSAGTIQDIKGSSEMHITDRVKQISQNLTPLFNESVIMLYSGTEYQSGESGKVILQVLKDVAGGGNNPITGLSCNDTILYPNGTIFSNVIMTELPSQSIGVYTHNFTAPAIEGIYLAYTTCTAPGKTYFGTHTFHVAPWANTIVSISSLLNSTYNLLLYINATTTSINGTVTNIQTTVTSMNNLLIFMNQTDTNTYNLLTTVNQEIVFINGSLNTLNTNVLNINGTLTYLKDVIIFINGTTTANSQSLLNINAVLARVNDTVLFINGTDTTILGIVNTTNNNVLFVNGTTTNINNYLQGYITSSLVNLTTTSNNIYTTVTFINSTSIEINGTTHNTYNYLTSTIYSLLYDINQTTKGTETDINSIIQRLVNLEQIVTTTKDFTQEQVFLITDSVGQLKQTTTDNSVAESDIKQTLANVERNLLRFQEITKPKTEESPVKLTNIDGGIVIFIIGIVIIVILSQYKGLERQDRKPPEKEEFRLPSLRDKR